MEGRLYKILWYFLVFPYDVLGLLHINIKLELAFILLQFYRVRCLTHTIIHCPLCLFKKGRGKIEVKKKDKPSYKKLFFLLFFFLNKFHQTFDIAVFVCKAPLCMLIICTFGSVFTWMCCRSHLWQFNNN